MALFEFLMVLVSVVIGLGLTEILSGGANLLRERDSVTFYWIHVLFQFGVFFALLQQWWESWDWVGLQEISFVAVLTLLASPVFLFLIAHLLFPSPVKDADLESYYYRQAPLLWGLVLAGTFVGTFIRPWAWGHQVFHVANLSGIPTVLICVALMSTKKPRVHSILAPLIIILVILDTLLARSAISAN